MTTKPRPAGTFAAKTKVAPSKTRSEIEALLLRANKASRILTMDEPAFFAVGFVMGERLYRIEVAVEKAATDQVRRARWRALLLVIKAKLEAVAQRISTIEDEFLSATVMPDGQTMRAWIGPRLAAAQRDGQMPLLPDYSGRQA